MDKDFNLEELEKFINLLKIAKDETSIESYIYIKNILNSVDFPITFTVYGKGTEFIRNRVHKNDDDFFTTIDQLSYRRDIQNIKRFGRANEPGQSLFYCSDNEIVSFVETSEIARNQIEKDYEFNTISTWVAIEDIYVISVLTNENIHGQNSDIDDLSKNFEDIFADQSDENIVVLKGFYEFLSKEFSQEAKGDSKHYKITTAFTNYIFDSVEKADGILYPSTLWTTEGFNFVFKQKTVDEKLQFRGAHRIKMQNMGNNKYDETEKISTEIHNKNDSTIKWIK